MAWRFWEIVATSVKPRVSEAPVAEHTGQGAACLVLTCAGSVTPAHLNDSAARSSCGKQDGVSWSVFLPGLDDHEMKEAMTKALATLNCYIQPRSCHQHGLHDKGEGVLTS